MDTFTMSACIHYNRLKCSLDVISGCAICKRWRACRCEQEEPVDRKWKILYKICIHGVCECFVQGVAFVPEMIPIEPETDNAGAGKCSDC